jgi:hypothetical protein
VPPEDVVPPEEVVPPAVVEPVPLELVPLEPELLEPELLEPARYPEMPVNLVPRLVPNVVIAGTVPIATRAAISAYSMVVTAWRAIRATFGKRRTLCEYRIFATS